MNGILLVDKPAGWTSNDVVCKMKGVLHERRTGHSGTLDPMATGLLPLFIGKATKAVEFAEKHSKKYIAGIKFGIVTDTQDTSGNIVSEKNCRISENEFLEAAKAFTGEIEQIPPMFSALKHNGKRLYDLARQGIEVERKPRKVIINDIEIISVDDGIMFFSVDCSAGTYVRTLCHDIGQYLGCGACMSSLRRTKCGEFTIDNAYTMDEIIECAECSNAEKLLLPVDSVFSDITRYICSEAEEIYIKNGRHFNSELSDGTYTVYSHSGRFLMLAYAENGVIKSRKNFFEV